MIQLTEAKLIELLESAYNAGAAAFLGMMVGVSFTVMCFVAGMR